MGRGRSRHCAHVGMEAQSPEEPPQARGKRAGLPRARALRSHSAHSLAEAAPWLPGQEAACPPLSSEMMC